MSSKTDIQINMSEIESRIKEGKFSVSVYADQTGISQTRIRNAIVERFGDKVVFRRGRNGGVSFVSPTQES